jgi:hypothetical protein
MEDDRRLEGLGRLNGDDTMQYLQEDHLRKDKNYKWLVKKKKHYSDSESRLIPNHR